MKKEKKGKATLPRQSTNEHSEEYLFMREVIKEKRFDKKHFLKRLLNLVVCGVIFGLVSAYVFSKALPYFQPEQETEGKFKFSEDEPTNSSGDEEDHDNLGLEDSSDNQGEEGANTEGDDIIGAKSLSLEGFRQVYQDIMDVAKTPEKAMVIIQGITSDVDWLNNSYENKKQVSGVIVASNDSHYYILTEYRVADQVESILVTLADQTTTEAKFVKKDPGTGLAILRIRKSALSSSTKKEISVAELGSSWNVARGESVLAIGSPTGYPDSIAYGMVTSTGNVRATLDTQYHLLTTDIIADGEGSGVLVNLDGEIIGIMVQSFSMKSDQNILTALPISEVKDVIEQLINEEDLIYFGIKGQDISSELSKKTGIPKGVYINSVVEDSPAMRDGIQSGDVVIKIENAKIDSLKKMKSTLNQYENGNSLSVTVMRKGASGYVEIVFDVTVSAL